MDLDTRPARQSRRIDCKIAILGRRSFAATDRQRREPVGQQNLHFDRIGSFSASAQAEQAR